MSDIFFQIFLALLGIVVGIVATSKEEWLKWMLWVFSILLILSAVLWWKFSSPIENPITTNMTMLENIYNQHGFELIWAGGEANGQDDTKLTQTRITSIVVENQSSVKVYYDWYNGVLSGILSGHTLSGIWKQDNGQGNFELTFAPDFSSAKGWWNSKNSPGQHDFYIQSP